MPKEYSRVQRVAEQVRRVLSQLLLTDVKDPRASLVAVTECEVSRDLSHATVYFSLLNPEADPTPAQEALQGAAGFLRSQLGKSLGTRQVPALKFVHDEAIARGARMTALIDDAVASDNALSGENGHE